MDSTIIPKQIQLSNTLILLYKGCFKNYVVHGKLIVGRYTSFSTMCVCACAHMTLWAVR